MPLALGNFMVCSYIMRSVRLSKQTERITLLRASAGNKFSANCGTLFLDLQSFQIYKNLAWLNGLPQSEAEAVFLACCRSTAWARRMAEARPFPMLEDMFEAAERTWTSLLPADVMEAFAVSDAKRQTATWPTSIQSGIEMDEDAVHNQFVEINRLYEDKFGFIFILCADGKTADEILTVSRARLGNSIETELKIATEEQRKITEVGLNKLLEQ